MKRSAIYPSESMVYFDMSIDDKGGGIGYNSKMLGLIGTILHGSVQKDLPHDSIREQKTYSFARAKRVRRTC